MSYCEVDFGDASDDADPVEFLRETRVTARKAHRCHECAHEIAAGETHINRAYKLDGDFYTERICDACREAASEFEYRIVGGSFWFHMQEEWDNGANVQGCINRLTTAKAKQRMHEQWSKWNDARVARIAERNAKRTASAQTPTPATNDRAVDPSVRNSTD